MSKTLTVEGDIATVDARTALTTQGSVTSPSMVTPSGSRKIDKIIAVASTEGLAAGSSTFYIRLGGAAVQRGEQVITISAAGYIAPQSGSDAAPQYCYPFVLDDADIEITPSDTISVFAEMAGQDTGTAHVGVTLVFA